MLERKGFADFPIETKVFYGDIVFIALLNIAAVKAGLFDVYLCETDDFFTWHRFYDQIPEFKHRLGLFNEPH